MIRVQEILDATGAELVRGDPSRDVHGVCTDTRTLERQSLFLALSGPRFNGNAFARQATDGGAGALLLRSEERLADALSGLPEDIPVTVHPDPRRALGDLASWHRSRLACPVVGITGSCGKTTTKEMLVQLLEPHRRVVASPRSFNNDIGVPLSVLVAEADTEVLVVEIGTNAPGEIEALCRIARPTLGVVTNVGASHLAGLGSLEGVAREKGALLAALPSDGCAILQADGGHYGDLRSRIHATRTITFSVEDGGDLNARRVVFHSGGTTFELEGREVTSPLLGVHNVLNLLSALAACRALGFELDELLPAISQLRTSPRRMERHDFAGRVVLDDTYNANPDSARAAVRVLAGWHGHRRRVLVLGDMLELGVRAPELHHVLGQEAAEAGIDLLVLVGELTRATAAGALEAGMPAERVLHVGDVSAATEALPELVEEGDVVLIKASNALGLHVLVERLGQVESEGGRA